MKVLVTTCHTQSPFGPGCLFLICFETQEGHRDGFGDECHTQSPFVTNFRTKCYDGGDLRGQLSGHESAPSAEPLGPSTQSEP